MTSPDDAAAELAHRSLASGDVTGWFDSLYAAAGRGEAVVPWDQGVPHPLLIDWAREQPVHEGRAVVVGSGPGHDAEYVASLGYRTTAFDVSPTAVEGSRRAHPESFVSYQAADLFDLPEEWIGAFDLVVEVMTVQAMPRTVRSQAIAAVCRLVAPGGRLLVIGLHLPGGRALDEGPPWPLTRDELAQFARDGLDGDLTTETRDGLADRYRYVLTRAR